MLPKKTKILLIYDMVCFPLQNAATIAEYVMAFKKQLKYKVTAINARLGFPLFLRSMDFHVIILHYSTFGMLSASFLNYLSWSKAYKIAIFQDEFHNCQMRFNFLNRYNIDCVYTLIDPQYINHVYGQYTGVKHIYTVLTGYVSNELIKNAILYSRPDNERTIDIGYRARKLSYYMGKGALEKYEIAEGFKNRLNAMPELVTDIETGESKRLYGKDWYRFMGNCKVCLGTMAGASIFDFDGSIQSGCQEILKQRPDITYEEIYRQYLHQFEGNIPNRVISPRIFEAAAFRVCQILFKDEYQGIVKPMVHYIPLEKDFSNFSEVMRLAQDSDVRRELTDNCYNDLIESEKYSYRQFIKYFDSNLNSDTRLVIHSHIIPMLLYLDVPVRWGYRIAMMCFWHAMTKIVGVDKDTLVGTVLRKITGRERPQC